MLRYADAIVKRGVDKLIDAIAHTSEPQTKNTETPQPQKRMGNDTDCGLTEQAITLMDEQCGISYNVLDCTPEVQRRDQTDKGFVPANISYISLHKIHKRPLRGWPRTNVRVAKGT